MSATLPWEQAWAYFNISDFEIQKDMLQQLEIKRLVRGCSPTYQKEILQYAPEAVIQHVKDVLYVETRVFLGLI